MRSLRRWRKRVIQSNARAGAAAVALVAAVLLAAFLLSGDCGGSSSELTPTPSPTAAPRSATPSAGPATPTPAPTSSTFEYEVQEGDTVADLAQRFGTTVEAIAEANGLSDPAAITVGQILIIRDASTTPPPTASPTPAPENPAGTGWTMPIVGGCLPKNEALWPNAPRAYRFGIHEGIDFYEYDNCTQIVEGTEVVSAGAGRVVRADHGFVEMTLEELNGLLTRSETQGYTDAEALDRFRGRQVWVDHGEGIVTRYAHLSGIPDDITEGTAVSAGEVIGFVGDSGTPEAVTNPGLEIHLHFEFRVGDSFLGDGLPLDQVQYLYNQVFSSP